MKKRKAIVYPILFGILMVLLFLPLGQQHLRLFVMKPLNGVYTPAKTPEFSFDKYVSSKWQAEVEPYVSENFGFREFVIRLYNQYLYDFFSKTYSHEVTIGKDGWLYQQDGINQYFGLLNRRYKHTNEEFKEGTDIQVRSLIKIRAILKEYGVETIAFTLPVKSYIYPEHLRPHHYEDTLFDVSKYYDRRLAEVGFPHINMTPWFQDIRDEYPFTLFYEKGSHWASGAVIGMDSVLRYMETLKGDPLPRIVLGTPYEVPEDQISPKDNDLCDLLNILRQPRQRMPLYEFPVSIVADSNTVYPNVFLEGTSYYWYITARIPLSKVFANRDFFYYTSTFFSDEEKKTRKEEDVSLLTELLTHDYVVYFRNGPQLYSNNYNFTGKALIALCISDERMEEKTRQVADSLAVVWQDEHPDWNEGAFRYHAKTLLLRNPEMFEELRGDAVPSARNPKIENVLAQRVIRNDREWRFLINAKAQNDSLNVHSLYAIEADNVLKGKTLLRNQTYFTTYDYFNFLVEETAKAIGQRPETPSDRIELTKMALDDVETRVQGHEFDNDSLMIAACTMDAIIRSFDNDEATTRLQEKAQRKGVSIDQAFREDVAWCLLNISDRSRYMRENTVSKAFDLYMVERRMRKDAPSMELVKQRRAEKNLPFRIAINHEIQWVYRQEHEK